MKRFSIADRTSPILDVIRSSMPFLDLDDGPWVAGGCGRLIFEDAQSLDRSDIDVFFTSLENMQWGGSMIERHARSQFIKTSSFNMTHAAPTMVLERRKPAADVEVTEPQPVIPPEVLRESQFTVQLISKFFRPTVEELIGSFDYEAAMFVTDGYEMFAREDAVVGDRVLRRAETGRIGHIGRLVKYCAKGFYPEPGILSATLKVNTDRFNSTDNLNEIITNPPQDLDYRDLP